MSSCSDIGGISDPAERCKMAIELCQQNSLVPFGELVYCDLESTFPRLVLLIFATFLLFGAIGVAAFDHLSPNLTYVAEVSGLSQQLMGVTVLAFGNGSADVFGAIMAFDVGEPALALGEIMGGAFFVVTVVVGSMALVQPIAVDLRLFLRDVVTLIVAATFSILIVVDGRVSVWEAVGGIGLYALYGVAAVNHHFKAKRDIIVDDEEIHMELPSEHGSSPGVGHRTGSPVQSTPRSGSASPEPVMIHPSLISSLELNRRVHKHLNENCLQSFPTPRHDSPLLPNQTPARRTSPHDPIPRIAVQEALSGDSDGRNNATADLADEEPQLYAPHALPSYAPPNHTASLPTSRLLSPINTALPSSYDCDHVDVLQQHSPFLMAELIDRLIEESPTPQETLSKEALSPYTRLLPFLEGLPEQGWPQRVYNLLMAPYTTMLAWSIPSNIDRLSLCMYAIGVPSSLPVLVAGIPFSWTVAAFQLTAALVLVILWGYYGRLVPPQSLMATIGFVMALLWVVHLSTELVSVLTLLGVVSHVSSTVMGLTVFALGDSLGDFVANLTVAQIGYAAMAFSACFGGPIFTILCGISGSALFTMAHRQQTEVKLPLSRGVLVSSSGLLLVLLLLTVLVIRNDNTVTKRTGGMLIGFWLVFVSLSVYINEGH